MTWMSADLKAALKGNHSIGYFFRLGTTPPGRIWTGAGDIVAGFSGLDEPGSVYRGAGILTAIPDIESLINGISAEVEFKISGISTDLSEELEPDMPDVTGLSVMIGLTALNPRFQLVAPLLPLQTGIANFRSFEQPRTTASADNIKRTYVLNCSFGETVRSRTAQLSYTSASQQTISADDAFCNRVSRYGQGNQVTWPRF